MEQRAEHSASAGAGDDRTACTWSEEVEDLLAAGDRHAAIARLESIVSDLAGSESEEPSSATSTSLQLSSALSELARIYSAAGFSSKADQCHSRSLLVRERALRVSSAPSGIDGKGLEDADPASGLSCSTSAQEGSSSLTGHVEPSTGSLGIGKDDSTSNGASDDDWEAMVDRDPNDLLPSESLPEISKLSVEENKPPGPKRRGRGTFSYKKDELYSDQVSDDSAINEESDERSLLNLEEESPGEKHSKYGTRHVLVLTDFPPSTRTMELERLVEAFKGRGVVIRWVNDTTALAVFRTPAIASEARDSIQFPFAVRIMSEDDEVLSLIQVRDLEPPRQRPQTSARTAQRLIAQSMGLKLPSSSSSREFKQQEEARKDRIIRRQKLRDDAWGPD